MNLIAAAKTVTTTIRELGYDFQIAATPAEHSRLYRQVNAKLPVGLNHDHLEDLFFLYRDADYFDTVLRQYASGPGNPKAEEEAVRSVHRYCTELSEALHASGYEGPEFFVDDFDDLP